MQYTLNIKGRLLDLGEPRVIGILNVTPDSFYATSRVQSEREVAERANAIIEQGGDIIDIGACSTRPGSTPVSEEDEAARLRMALEVVRREQPSATISVDTFRPAVARMAVEDYGADIINDVGGGEPDMLQMVTSLGVPYILMSSQPMLESTLLFFAERVAQLRAMGQKDIILDPGFGFGKTMQQNYELLNRLDHLLVMELPLLVGVSRKSMIYKLLNVGPEEALSGTTALNAIALAKGASILRVHDVKEAVDTCKVITACGLNER